MSIRRARLVTLGCKVNQYETQFVREMLLLNGYAPAEESSLAELCIVNTCTVTHEADAKSRQTIRRLGQANPGAQLVVMGCYATRDPEAIRQLPGVTHVITDKTRLLEAFAPYGITSAPAGISRFDDHQRAFVKVQDGCMLNCSYCIIPSVRSVVRSRPVAEIADEVTRLVESGYHEIVLTGIHLGHYGIDLSRGKAKPDWVRLWHLLDRLATLPGDFRLRLSSLEAAEARDDLLRVLAAHPRICPHLHLCVQSGSDRILAAMKRRYRAAGLLQRIERIRQALDEPAFSTDVIVGFPGETEADFAETCRVMREGGFSRIHVFPYSPRQGTVAASLPDDVPPAVKAERRQRLRELETELALAYHRRLLGRTLDVLVEGNDPAWPGYVRGTACRYATVRFPGIATHLIRQRVAIRAVSIKDGIVVGEPVDQSNRVGEASVPRSRRLALPILAIDA